MLVDATLLKAGALEPPPSKSDAQRALVLAWLLKVPPPQLAVWPLDARRLADGLAALGTGQTIDCGDGAAPFRTLLALAATDSGTTVLTGTERLHARPHGALLEALGVSWGPFPITVVGRRLGGDRIAVDCSASSQYASALLFCACREVLRRAQPFTVMLRGSVASRGYLDLTVGWVRAAGFEVEAHGGSLQVISHRKIQQLPDVPPDWSSLGYLLLMAKAAGSRVEAPPKAVHPDRAIVEHLAAFERDGNVHARVSNAPDLAPTLAALALTGGRPSTLSEAGILRGKESDRLGAIIALAEAVGGRATLRAEQLTLDPPRTPPQLFRFDCRGDHRMIMTAVSLACLFRCQAELEDCDGVDKSFPGFFEQAQRVGVRVTARSAEARPGIDSSSAPSTQ